MFLVGYTKNAYTDRLTRMPGASVKFATAASKILPGLILAMLVFVLPLNSQAQSVEGDGSLDPTFTSPYSTSNDYISGLAVQADGKILVITTHPTSVRLCGMDEVFTCYDCPFNEFNLTRLNTDGSFANFVALYGRFGFSVFAPRSLAVQSDGKFLAAGDFESTTFDSCGGVGRWGGGIQRYNADGSLDTTFMNIGTEFEALNGAVNQVIPQSDGKILVAGNFSSFRGVDCKGIARLNPDGNVDPSFPCSSNDFRSTNNLLVQSDGKLLASGGYSETLFVKRLNSDGSLDTTFNSISGANGAYRYVNSIALQTDGKILVSGTTNSNSNPYYTIRLKSDGSLDNPFNLPLAHTSGSVAIQTNGKILLGSSNGVTRYNTDGSLDSSFSFTSACCIYETLLQKDDKLLLGGKFSNAAGYSLARLGNRPRFTTTTSLASSASPVTYGQSVVLTATVSSSASGVALPSGTVTFTLPGFTSVRANVTGGVASYIMNGLPAGSYTVTASYSGDINYKSSTAASPLNLVVEKIQTSTSLASSASVINYGQSIELTATVASPSASQSAPGGTVTFDIPGGGSVVATLFSGVASYVTNTLPVGSYVVTATYNGDSRYKPSASTTSNLVVEKAPSLTKLTSSANPAVISRTLTFTILVAPLPASASGTVSFNFSYGDGTSFTSDPVTLTNGVASFVTETLATGSYTVTASYSGDANHLAGNSPAYTQYIVSGCDPLVVSASSDDGKATTCGSFSYALAQTIAGTISFDFSNGGGASTLSFSGEITPTLKPGVAIDGGANGVILSGSGVIGDGLQLGGNNQLTNLTIRGFGGRELVVIPGTNPSRFYHVKIEN